MTRLRQPGFHYCLVFFTGESGLGGDRRFHQVLFREFGDGGHVLVGHGAERRFLPQDRVLLHQFAYTVKGESELEVERLLGPQGPVIVKNRDPFFRRHEVVARTRGGINEQDDGLLGSA